MHIEDVLKQDNIGSRQWVKNLQRALDAAGYNKNSSQHGFDGRLGKDTRADLIQYLKDHPELQDQIGNKLENYLSKYEHSFSSHPTKSDPVQEQRSETVYTLPPLTKSSPKDRAFEGLGNVIAKAEHVSGDIPSDKIYDIKNGRVYPKINGVRRKATDCSIGEMMTARGSHGKFQINHVTFPDYLQKGSFRHNYICKQLGVNSTTEIKALPFNKDVQNVMGNALLEDAGFTAMLTGALSIEQYQNKIAKIWMSLPKDAGGKGYHQGDKHGNHATVKYNECIKALKTIRDNFITENLTHDLAKAGINLSDNIPQTSGMALLKDPNLIKIFRDHPQALLSLSPESRAILINKGYGDALQTIVDRNPIIRSALEDEAREIIAKHDLKTLKKDPELLYALQANWTLQGAYTGSIDGKSGPSTEKAYASQHRIDKNNETKSAFVENAKSFAMLSFGQTQTYKHSYVLAPSTTASM